MADKKKHGDPPHHQIKHVNSIILYNDFTLKVCGVLLQTQMGIYKERGVGNSGENPHLYGRET